MLVSSSLCCLFHVVRVNDADAMLEEEGGENDLIDFGDGAASGSDSGSDSDSDEKSDGDLNIDDI